MTSKIQVTNSALENKYNTAIENLKKYNQGTTLLDMNFPKYVSNVKYTEPLNKLRIQNSDLRECCFLSSINRTNFSGSRLNKCEFNAISLENSNFQFSNMHECTFECCEIEGSNFSNCFFDSTTFENNNLMGSNFLRSQFNNCHIRGGEILSTSLEFAQFQNTYFEDIRLANLSMEYAEFNQVHMHNVVLPFSQLPFIFGGLDYVMSTNDRISISANMDGAWEISVDEYIGTLEDWKIFFYKRELYFPLSNILLAQSRKKEALETILSGILAMINHADYRMLKYLCKLAASHPSVSKPECKMLYSRINDLILLTPLSQEQQYNYTTHMGEIRNILVENPKEESRLYLSINTNILVDKQDILFRIIKFIEMLLDCPVCNLTTKTISFKHDSPYIIILIAIGGLYTLNKITKIVSEVVSNVKVTIDDIMSIRDICNNQAENDDLENETKKTILQKERLEVEKLMLEIGLLQKELNANDIQTNVTHNIKEHDKIYIA